MYLLIYVWLIVCGLSLIVEYFTQKLIAIWCSIGAFVASVLAAFLLKWYYQVGSFVLTSLILTLLLRNPFLRRADKSYKRRMAFSAMGKQFDLLTPITIKSAGTIRIEDGVFEVVCEDGAVLPEGALVQVVGFKEGKITVKDANNDV